KGASKMNNTLTYIQNGDYLIPNLQLTEQPETPLGKYGRMRKTYLKEHRPILYNRLLMSEKLYPHLLEIDRTANSRLEQLMPKLAQAAGVTEELKARDMMQWVGLMNSCKAQAEEILLAELINS
ncbi:TnpV protein, partial [Faecalibaculum rodentium]|uniref:TnpV protein n=1 Tax=Faecalibaculum rodentium TaxID=1702221 RepID=UPI003F732FA8